MSTKPYPNTVLEASNMAFGSLGFDEISGSTNGNFFCFKAVGGNATVAATSNIGDDLTSVEVQNGDYIFGNFSNITPSVGTVLAYRLS